MPRLHREWRQTPALAVLGWMVAGLALVFFLDVLIPH